MAALSTLLERIGPLAGIGNAGAVANAGRACDERRQIEAATDDAIRAILVRQPLAIEPARRSA
jgi:hypothetical protein